MPLSFTPERFEELRRRVAEKKLADSAKEALNEHATEEVAFESVDAFLDHLDKVSK